MRFFIIAHAHKDPLDDAPLFWSNEDGWVSLVSASVFTEKDIRILNLPLEAWGWLELPNTLFEEFQAIQYASDAVAAATAEDIPF